MRKKLLVLLVTMSLALGLSPALSLAVEDDVPAADEGVAAAQLSDNAVDEDPEGEFTLQESIVQAIYLTYDAPVVGQVAPSTVAIQTAPAEAVSATTLGVQWSVAGKLVNGQLVEEQSTLAAGDPFQAGYLYYPIFNEPTLESGYFLRDSTLVYINGKEVGSYTQYSPAGERMPGYYYGPLVANPTTLVTGYNLVVDEPVAGKTPDTTATVTFTTADGTVAATQDVTVTWMEYSTPDRTGNPDAYSTSKFQAGKYYWVSDIFETSEGSYSIGAFQALPSGCYYDVFEDDTYAVNVNSAPQAFFGPLEAVGDYELTYTYDDVNQTATVTGLTGEAGGSLTIPATTTKDGVEYTVTTIKSSAFSGKTAFTGSLSIPNTVTAIESSAFNGCSNLSGTLTIPGSVTSIGNNAFQSCSNFTALEFESGEGTLTIGTCAFYRCSGFAGTLSIPARVTSIGNEAFEYCQALTGLAFEAGSQLTTISQKAFYECRGLTGDLTLPDNVTTIGKEAFYYCKSLNGTLTLPSGITTIGQDAFSQCAFTGDLVVPSSLTAFDGAFYHAGNFRNVTLAEGLTTIGKSAFTGTGITGTLSIPSTITAIPEYAFWACKYEGNLIIPATVTTIGNNAFDSFGVEGKTGTLTFAESSNLETIGVSAFERSYISGTLDLPDSVTSIGEEAFCNAKYITGLTLPENEAFTTIPKMAFGNSNTSSSSYGYDVMGITGTVNIPANVTTICEYAFQDNRYLQGLSFATGSKLASIADNAFRYCGISASSPGGLALPDSLTTIGNYAFYYCGFTGDLAIPDSVTSMGEFAFANCKNFKGALRLPDNNSFTAVPNGAFDQCEGIVGPLELPDNVKTIGEQAFRSCSSLTATITGNGNVLDGVESINDYAFYYCKAFTGTLTIPSSVTYLGPHAFGSCLGITQLDMHQSDTVLRAGVFGSCENLVNVGTIPSSVKEIGNEVFKYCFNLSGDITIPEGVETIGGEVFWDTKKLTGTITIPSSVTSLSSTALWISHFTTIVNNSAQTLNASYVAGTDEYIVDSTGKQVDVIGTGTYTRKSGSTPPASEPVDISKAKVTLTKASSAYTGKAQKGAVKSVVLDGKTLVAGTDYKVSAASGTAVGSYKVTVTGVESAGYKGSANATFKITKATNTLNVKNKTATVKYAKVKKKDQKLKVGSVVKFINKGQGTLTYAKKKGNKKITIAKNGQVTVKKGLKKGTYTVKMTIKAAGNANYKASAVKTVSFKVKVK